MKMIVNICKKIRQTKYLSPSSNIHTLFSIILRGLAFGGSFFLGRRIKLILLSFSRRTNPTSVELYPTVKQPI